MRVAAVDGSAFKGDVHELGTLGRAEERTCKVFNGKALTVEDTGEGASSVSDTGPFNAFHVDGSCQASVDIAFGSAVNHGGKPHELIRSGDFIESVFACSHIVLVSGVTEVAHTILPFMLVLYSTFIGVGVNGSFFVCHTVAMQFSVGIDNAVRGVGHGQCVLSQGLEPCAVLALLSVQDKAGFTAGQLFGRNLDAATGNVSKCVQVNTIGKGTVSGIAGEHVAAGTECFAHVSDHHTVLVRSLAGAPSAETAPRVGRGAHESTCKGTVLNGGLSFHKGSKSAIGAVATHRTLDSDRTHTIEQQGAVSRCLCHQTRGILAVAHDGSGHIKILYGTGQQTEERIVLAFGCTVDGDGVVRAIKDTGIGDTGSTDGHIAHFRQVDVGC